MTETITADALALLLDGASIKFSKVDASNVLVTINDNKTSGLAYDVTIPVHATNPISVEAPVPTVSSINPSSASKASNSTVFATYTGTKFKPGTVLYLEKDDSTLQSTQTTFTSVTSMTAKFNLSNTVATGVYTVRAKYGDYVSSDVVTFTIST